MIIAITGSIGSGKTTVLNIIKEKCVAVISVDELNEMLIQNKEYIKEIASLFPDCIVNGVIDKRMLRNIIFNNNDKRLLLNSVAHKRIDIILRQQVDFARQKGNDLVVEVPLLIECNMQSIFDEVWVVVSDKSIERAALRDNTTYEDIKKIQQTQVDNKQRIKYATEIINNSSDITYLKEQVTALLLKKGIIS